MATRGNRKAGNAGSPREGREVDEFELPLPGTSEEPTFNVLDYLFSEEYAGTGTLRDAIEMRGAAAFARETDPRDFLPDPLARAETLGIAELWAQSTWGGGAGGRRDVEREREAAELAEGDMIEARRLSGDRDGRGYAFFRADGRALPFEPYHDFDDLFFERALAGLAEGERLLCRVRDTACFGSAEVSDDPGFDWRVYSCKVTVLRAGAGTGGGSGAGRQGMSGNRRSARSDSGDDKSGI